MEIDTTFASPYSNYSNNTLSSAGWWNQPNQLNSQYKNLKRTADQVRSVVRQAKRQRTASRTRTKRKSSVGKQVEIAGGESKSYFQLIKKNKSKLGGLELAESTVNRSVGFSRSSTQGVQNSSNLGTAFDATDLTNIRAATGLTAAGFAALKVYLKSYRSAAYITNAETTNCHITIYECEARQDGGALNTDASTTFLAGYLDASGGAAANATLMDSTPFANPRFTEAYRIRKTIPLILSPGHTHCHRNYYAANQMVSMERYLISGVGGGPIGQLSLHTFIVYHGTPIHDDTDETLVSIGKSKLDIVLTEEIRYKFPSVNYPNNSITSTLATNLTPFQMAENAPTDIADDS